MWWEIKWRIKVGTDLILIRSVLDIPYNGDRVTVYSLSYPEKRNAGRWFRCNLGRKWDHIFRCEILVSLVGRVRFKSQVSTPKNSIRRKESALSTLR